MVLLPNQIMNAALYYPLNSWLYYEKVLGKTLYLVAFFPFRLS